jgi:N-acetylglucosamine kinase-like BadF-type ATPase
VNPLKSKKTSDDLLLVVDAGGTKTAAWLVDGANSGEHRILGRGLASAGNPLSAGFPEATRAILEATTSALSAAAHNGRVSRALMSIAGAANPRLRDHFLDWAQSEGFAKRLAIVPDVLPVLAAGSTKCCGVALIAGTGSVAMIRSADGHSMLVGGWGYLLGDEGSGYSIGRAALQHTLACLEANSERGILVQSVLEKTSVKSVRELTSAVYEQPFPRIAIAAMAPLVMSAAEAGEAVATAILDGAARELAELVGRAATYLDSTDNPVALAASGGILVGSARLQQSLRNELGSHDSKFELRVVDEPLDGCVRLAAPEFAESLVKWQ